MRAFFLFFLLNLGATSVNAQQKNLCELEFADVFVLKVKIKNKLVEGNCPCFAKKNKFALYEIEIDRVLYCAANTVIDSVGLSKLKYIAIQVGTKVDIQIETSILLTAKPSSSYRYLMLTRVINDKEIENCKLYHVYAYQSGITICKKQEKDPFEYFITEQEKLATDNNK
jgi:hypothetical protein